MRVFFKRIGFLFLLVCLAAVSVSGIYLLFLKGNTILPDSPQQRAIVSSTATPGITVTTPPKPCEAKQRSFEMGVAFPQYRTNAYGGSNTTWLTEMPQMRAQTSACWVEMPILFRQSSLTSTTVMPGPSTPSIASFTYGIQFAHSLGLHVYVSTLLYAEGPQAWSGAIKFTTGTDEQAWFGSYWEALKPYAQAASQAGVEQFSIGTEEEWLQINAPADLWNSLINNLHSVFAGPLTYNMNWSDLVKPVPAWMSNANLKLIGISTYLPQVNSWERLDEQQIANLWATSTKPELDTFATALGKPLFLSELGYRNDVYALYQPWASVNTGPADPAEQAAACQAALDSIISDQNIVGVFFWGWDSTGAFNLKDSQAASVIQHYYSSWQN